MHYLLMISPFESADSAYTYLLKSRCSKKRADQFLLDTRSKLVSGVKWENLKKRVDRIYQTFLLDAYSKELSKFNERTAATKFPPQDPLAHFTKESSLRLWIIKLRFAETFFFPLNHIGVLHVIRSVRTCVENLEIGEKMTIPAGWCSLPERDLSGHFAVQVIQFNEDGYSITTINSMYNPFNSKYLENGTIPAYLSARGLSINQVKTHLFTLRHLSPVAFKRLTGIYFNTLQPRSTNQYVGVINKKMYGPTSKFTISEKRIPPQRANTCVQSAIAALPD